MAKSSLLSRYEELPWMIQSTNPILLIVGPILYFHFKLSLNLFEFLGVTFSVICSFYLIFHSCQFLYRNWIGVMLGHNTDLTKLGSWAVVTGPTQGIGKAYAMALAKRGLNLVLIARSPEKLYQVGEEIREQYGVKVEAIPADFTEDTEIYERIHNTLKDLEVGILINNVGMCYQAPEYFSDLPGGNSFCKDLINCNILSVTMMTRICLPGMLRRKKGVVVNIGSMSGIIDTPFLALYGATKSFMDKFTTDLQLEYEPHGVTFQSVIPGYVVSNMSKIKKSNMFIPTPDDFVEAALRVIGLQKRTTVWLSHQLVHFVIKVGYFFRRDGGYKISQIILNQLWLYGKKVMIRRVPNVHQMLFHFAKLIFLGLEYKISSQRALQTFNSYLNRLEGRLRVSQTEIRKLNLKLIERKENEQKLNEVACELKAKCAELEGRLSDVEYIAKIPDDILEEYNRLQAVTQGDGAVAVVVVEGSSQEGGDVEKSSQDGGGVVQEVVEMDRSAQIEFESGEEINQEGMEVADADDAGTTLEIPEADVTPAIESVLIPELVSTVDLEIAPSVPLPSTSSSTSSSSTISSSAFDIAPIEFDMAMEETSELPNAGTTGSDTNPAGNTVDTGEGPASLHGIDVSGDSNTFKCICGKQFETRKGLSEHILASTMERKFPCTICGKRFPRYNISLKHRARVHKLPLDESLSKSVGCRKCGHVLPSRGEHSRHAKVCKGRSVFQVKRKEAISLRSYMQGSIANPNLEIGIRSPFPTPIRVNNRPLSMSGWSHKVVEGLGHLKTGTRKNMKDFIFEQAFKAIFQEMKGKIRKMNDDEDDYI